MKEVLQTRREQLQQRIEQNRREREVKVKSSHLCLVEAESLQFAMEEKERMVREVDDIEQQNALQVGLEGSNTDRLTVCMSPG
mmetsp:Transcript_47813/g.149921  ORF Transcript_47813/g.149921 Transcript_47813/m.149921 type:complete len:83 (+) Transcript_47813:2360-2608(+)